MDEFGLSIKQTEAQLFVSKSSARFPDSLTSGYSSARGGATIRSHNRITTATQQDDGTNYNFDGITTIYGELEYENSATFLNSGLYAGITGNVVKSGTTTFRSAGVVGIGSASGLPSTHYNGIPTKSYGVVSVGDSFISGSLEVAGPVGNITASGTVDANRVNSTPPEIWLI